METLFIYYETLETHDHDEVRGRRIEMIEDTLFPLCSLASAASAGEGRCPDDDDDDALTTAVHARDGYVEYYLLVCSGPAHCRPILMRRTAR